MAKSPKPTDGELAILRVLWRRGRSTVREIQSTMNAAKPTGYTTVLKLLQIMADKGLVDRDESAYAHVYKARRPEAQTQQTLVADLLDRAFDGSYADSDRKSTRLNSSHLGISYAVFCLKKKKKTK